MPNRPDRPGYLARPFSWLTCGLLWLLAQLPHRLLLWLGAGLGWLFRVVFRFRRRVIENNLRACFPDLSETALRRLVRANYRETGMMVTQTLRTFFNRSAAPFRGLEIAGREHLERCLAEGQGVLLVSGHFTALDVGGRAICEQYPVAGVYRPHKNPVQEYMVRRSRLHYAQQMFSRDELKGIVKYLKSGGVVWYAPDQDYRRGQSVFADFFGVPASTITATHQLARISGCQVMFYSVQRLSSHPHYQLSLSAPLTGFPGKDAVADTTRINQGIEAMVKDAPDQYLWLHKRFKTRPEGEEKFY